MEEAMEILGDVKVAVGVAFAVGCWLTFAGHPTAAGFRQAVVETLEI
jgi:hypothetical protein